jgi:hypothetical protein
MCDNYVDEMLITKCFDIANSKGILTAHDIANEMRLARKPSNNPVIIDMSRHPTPGLMYQAIYKSMKWLRNYNRAFKKGEPTMTVTDNITIETVGSITYEPCTATGFSFTLDNPTITKDIIDKLTIKPNDVEDAINRELFTFKKQEAPIRPLRYWQTDNGCITVEWTDHTKTTVTPSDPEHADVFSGICIAYTKKMFGSTTAIMRSIEQAKWLTDMPKRRKETERRHIKESRERKQKRAKEHREAMIESRVEDIKIEQEAQKRIAKEKEASNNA